MMEQVFHWDHDRFKLIRSPECPLATKEENMQGALDIQAIQGTDKVARETAMYRMAMKAYTLRDWYQPCRSLPGGAEPVFMHRPSNETYRDVRDGIRILRSASSGRDAATLKEKFPEAERAARFQDYVLRVSTVEAFNEGSCRPLLMAHAWLKKLNPDGDRAAILLLDGLVQEWYGIMEPELETKKRHAQARHAAVNYTWLSKTWRDIWERP